jgi:hypothetical protein
MGPGHRKASSVKKHHGNAHVGVRTGDPVFVTGSDAEAFSISRRSEVTSKRTR